MQSNVLIIGGGLSGLVATWQLSLAGHDVMLAEARNRYGGRALTLQQDGILCDVGPSWFWDGQPLIAALLDHFGISYFEQYSDGAILVQQPDGAVIKSPMQSPMFGSRRIDGGVTQLVNALTDTIPASQRLLEHAVKEIALDGDDVLVTLQNRAEIVQVRAKHVALAMPLRLASEIKFSPSLPVDAHQTLVQTPTWMAGHAKFFASYDRPFWREQGLCGTAISRRGPLAEIHDGSPNTGDGFNLFGFVGISAPQRAQMGREQVIEQSIAQLVALFGDEARNPKFVYLQDWSTEDFTASAADRQAQTRHPDYGITLNLGDDWGQKLAFIVSETAPNNSGLIEGALEAGLRFATHIANTQSIATEDDSAAHQASMDWDWLR